MLSLMRTMTSKAQTVNHPVRLDIIFKLAERQMTTKQLGELLPDIPQATLYRHLNVLLEGKVIEVVGQRLLNGITESTYALRINGAKLSPEEFGQMDAGDHRNCFALLSGQAAKELERYLLQPEINPTKDGMTYFAAKLSLTGEESRSLKSDLLALVERYIREPNPESRNQLITISSIPEPKK